MSARDDYPYPPNSIQTEMMAAEIDKLRADLAVMTQGVEDAAEDRDIAQAKIEAVNAALEQYDATDGTLGHLAVFVEAVWKVVRGENFSNEKKESEKLVQLHTVIGKMTGRNF